MTRASRRVGAITMSRRVGAITVPRRVDAGKMQGLAGAATDSLVRDGSTSPRHLRATTSPRRASAALTFALSGSLAAGVSVTALAPVASAATVDRYTVRASSTVNVRATASTSARIVGTLTRGTQVAAWVPVTGWYQILSGPYTGKYVSRSVVTSVTRTSSTSAAISAALTNTTKPSTNPSPVDPASSPEPSVPGATPMAFVTFSATTNVRSAASPSAAIVGSLRAGTKVTGVKQANGWVRLSTPASYAGRYVAGSVLSSNTAETPWTPAPNTVGPAAQVVSVAGQDMLAGFNGIKVYLAQRALGLRPGPLGSTMDGATQEKLRAFQSGHGLPATGIIDRRTWDALKTGYSFDVDGWKQPSLVATDASREARVEAMIDWAMSQVGKPYIWGSTGAPDGVGYDCSGFVLQAMRAGGVDPLRVYNAMNTRPASDLANQMYRDTEFQKGTVSSLMRGDLIYYGNSPARAGHVALYLGNNQVIHAVTLRSFNGVQISTLSSNMGWAAKIGVNRPFSY